MMRGMILKYIQSYIPLAQVKKQITVISFYYNLGVLPDLVPKYF